MKSVSSRQRKQPRSQLVSARKIYSRRTVMRRTILSRASLRILFLVMAAMFIPRGAWAADGTLTDDAHISAKSSGGNFGGNPSVLVEGGNATGFLKFDLSNVPANTTGDDVIKATLKLWVGNVRTAGYFDIRRVMGAWNEGSITFTTAPSLGSVDASAVAVTSVAGNTFLTVELTGLVKDWLNGALPNNGLALSPNGSISVQFDSKENSQTSHHSQLEILLKGAV